MTYLDHIKNSAGYKALKQFISPESVPLRPIEEINAAIRAAGPGGVVPVSQAEMKMLAQIQAGIVQAHCCECGKPK